MKNSSILKVAEVGKSRRVEEHAGPSISPCTLLEFIRPCIPDGAPILESEMRAHVPQIDACLEEMHLAATRRYEDEQGAE